MPRDTKLFPEGLAGYVESNLERELIVIVSATTGRLGWLVDELVQSKLVTDLDTCLLPIIDAVEVEGNGRSIATLTDSPNVESVWFIHPAMREAYMSIVRGMEYFARDMGNGSPPIVNLSLAPPSELLPIPFRPHEPLNTPAVDRDLHAWASCRW